MEDMIWGGRDVTYNRLKKKADKLKQQRMEQKTCGKCKYLIPQRRDRLGHDGRCREILVKENETGIADFIYIRRSDEGCEHFEPQEVNNV